MPRSTMRTWAPASRSSRPRLDGGRRVLERDRGHGAACRAVSGHLDGHAGHGRTVVEREPTASTPTPWPTTSTPWPTTWGSGSSTSYPRHRRDGRRSLRHDPVRPAPEPSAHRHRFGHPPGHAQPTGGPRGRPGGLAARLRVGQDREPGGEDRRDPGQPGPVSLQDGRASRRRAECGRSTRGSCGGATGWPTEPSWRASTPTRIPVEGLRQIRCPTLILLGEHDIVFLDPSALMAGRSRRQARRARRCRAHDRDRGPRADDR